MIKKIFLFNLGFFLFPDLLAKEELPLPFLKKTSFKEKKITFEIKKNKYLLKGYLQWGPKKIKKYQKSAAGEALTKYREFEINNHLYIAIAWRKGMHSETIEIWRFPEAKIIWSKHSYYAVLIDKTKKGFSVSYTNGDESDFSKPIIKKFP